VTIRDGACPAIYLCIAEARVAGRETVKTPAGSFDAIKVTVEQSWRAAGHVSQGAAAARLNGGRVLTIWYAPAVKRAVKYSSRLTVGDDPAVESNFELELVSYQPGTGEAPKVEPARVAAAAAASPLPRAGDGWTYRLAQLDRKEEQRYTVSITSASSAAIAESFSVEGGASGSARHERGPYLAALGPALFSPYLPLFEELAPGSRLGRVTIRDGACPAIYLCIAEARVAGREAVKTPAGSFDAIKVTVEQSWRAAGHVSQGAAAARLNGGRVLTVWYAPAVKRAVRYSSRLTVGDDPAVESNFDLELVSYRLQ
jgi:hypothetical protein